MTRATPGPSLLIPVPRAARAARTAPAARLAAAVLAARAAPVLLAALLAGGGAVAVAAAPVAAAAAPALEVRAAAATPGLPPRPAARPGAPALVVFLGDSLTAGMGLAADQAYPSLLAKQLPADGLPVRVINAGVSGDTTAGGLSRLPWLLAQHPAVVVVGLGGNDGMRGQPIEGIERNLRTILARCRQAGVGVLLLGMQIPPNYGPEYTGAFAAIYPRIAQDMKVPLVPFLLAGVGGIPALNQADGVHPTAAGQVIVAANVKPYLECLLRR